MRILVPDSLADELLGTLPPEVELIRIGDGPIPPEASDARMALLAGVLPRRLDEIPAAAPNLRVLQTVSAGVDWLVGRVPTASRSATPAACTTPRWPSGWSRRSWR